MYMYVQVYISTPSKEFGSEFVNHSALVPDFLCSELCLGAAWKAANRIEKKRQSECSIRDALSEISIY